MDRRYVFSVPAYFLATGGGCVVFAAITGLALGFHWLFLAAVVAAGLVMGLLPAMLAFLPLVLLSIWIGNRFKFKSAVFAVALGGAGAALMFLVPAAGAALLLGPSINLGLGWVFAVAGGAAGYLYFLLEREDRRAYGRNNRASATDPEGS